VAARAKPRGIARRQDVIPPGVSGAASGDLPVKLTGTGVGRDPGLLLLNDGWDPLRLLKALPPGERLKTAK
jgi:hypothetical protein